MLNGHLIALQMTKGKLWPLIHYFCLISALLSMVLNCVPTIMMLTPVVIRICEVTNLRPQPILIMMVIFANLAGIVTPIGNPPNTIITSNAIIESHITFIQFVLHVSVGIALAAAAAYVQLRFCHFPNRNAFYLHSIDDEKIIKKEIEWWQRAAAHLSTEEIVMRDQVDRKLDHLDHQLIRTATLIDVRQAQQASNTLMVDLEKKVFFFGK